MRVHIQWEPDPDDLGYDAEGKPRARSVSLEDDVLVVWVDRFGTSQYVAAGMFDTDAIHEAVEGISVNEDVPTED